MSALTAQEIYRTWVWPLPITERLRLASLILNDLAPGLLIDEGDAWSAEDMRDLSVFALQHAWLASDEESGDA